MPKLQRTPEEVGKIRENILKQAVQLMNKVGYQDFSMRRLARAIKVTPPTLYNYYQDKDELYLCILTKGFSRLYELHLAAYNSSKDPFERLQAIVKAFIDFGLNSVNFYNLMFTWHVPKYNEYRGAPLEPIAKIELDTSQQVSNLCIKVMKECAGKNHTLSEEDARFLLVYYLSTLHGYVASLNNTLLNYIHETPMSVKEEVLEILHDTFVREVRTRRVRITSRAKRNHKYFRKTEIGRERRIKAQLRY
jgi:AcrR family transcriptional regulator